MCVYVCRWVYRWMDECVYICVCVCYKNIISCLDHSATSDPSQPYVCVHMCVYVCICEYKSVDVCIYGWISVCTYECVYVRNVSYPTLAIARSSDLSSPCARICVCMGVYVCICVYTWMDTCVRTYVCVRERNVTTLIVAHGSDPSSPYVPVHMCEYVSIKNMLGHLLMAPSQHLYKLITPCPNGSARLRPFFALFGCVYVCICVYMWVNVCARLFADGSVPKSLHNYQYYLDGSTQPVCLYLCVYDRGCVCV